MVKAQHEWAALVQAESPKIIAALARQCKGDLQLSEDALQDALEQALKQWKQSGEPERPGAWLMQVARCRLVDRLRQRACADRLRSEHLVETASFVESDDQRLALIFCCCHPAVDETSQLALLLQLLGGLSYREIASQLLLGEAVVQRRLSRAKNKIVHAQIPMEIPVEEVLFSRQGHVRSMIYLLFNHALNLSVDKARPLLSQCIELLHLLRNEIDSAESMGLHALLMSILARRVEEPQEFQVLGLSEQNRKDWDQELIAQADELLQRALSLKELGPMQLQAAIQLLHSQAVSWSETDWQQIIHLYELLSRFQQSPLPKLNQAMARFYAGENADIILKQLDELSAGLNEYSGFYAARMQLLLSQGMVEQARSAYQEALNCEQAPRQRQLLEWQWQRSCHTDISAE